MNKIKAFLFKDLKDSNKIILSLGCIIFLVCVVIISYWVNNSFALFSMELSGSRDIKMHYASFTKNFSYKGEPEEYKVKSTGYYYIEMAGASGGLANARGAKTSGYIYLEKDTKLYFYVGKAGSSRDTNCNNYEFNGGGMALSSKTGVCGLTGGGATDVRLVGGSWDNTSSLISRIMVAGAGGGGGGDATWVVGSGGTLYGVRALNGTFQQYLGNPGTQTSGGAVPTQYSGEVAHATAGSFGKGGSGGSGVSSATTGGGAGGGSGYYGGSGSSQYATGGFPPSSGGSSYISGYAGVDSVTESTTITHTGQTKHYSGKYFIGADMISGQNSGNGYAKIRFVGDKPVRKNTKLNNVRYIRDCKNFNTINQGNHWSEIQAIKDGVNIAKGKTVTGTSAAASDRPYSRVTDGDITPANWASPATHTANQCVTVDLGASYDLDEVATWGYFADFRKYQGQDVSVSSDNSTWTNLADDEVWYETSNGARWNAYIDHINGYRGRSKLNIWYDGLSNSGSSKNFTTTTWKNLIYASTTYNGSIMNGTAAGATWGGYYLTLDGTNDYVNIGAVNYTNPTIEIVFAQSSDVSTTRYLVSNISANAIRYGYGMYVSQSLTGFIVGISDSYTHVDSTYSYSSDIKAQAVSYNSSTLKVFKNGVMTNSSNASGTIRSSSSNLMVGNTPNGNNYFPGKIYSVRVYNGVLTDEQMYHNYLYDKQLYNLGD